ncbi:peptidoglycan DD-metalloendopeptidase family protein [Nocardioides sp. dk4132]|uniref:M23 family metallopeptidase n=1 Tax=unclassified Nocardioides TaxID=2615069 RepID=UPI0012949AF7|nr:MULTISPECIES: M23 family metallopeptidase [unclassified Nocardioides]MQW77670.1 peptidoglycan DD-metalloendopeptidase family protein [Nocardioides sp. dk4132]QGA07133.1 peptidoglycan DD-metalloendopeptidase family protein [Nocardioides sp. dk884]
MVVSRLSPRVSSRLRAAVVGLALGCVPLLGGGPAAGAEDPVGVWPLAPVPEVVARFDPPEQPWGPGHRGVDLLGVPGARVRAALPGTVTFAGRLAGRGVVVVDHGATRTTYEPVTAGLEVGAAVPAGGALGSLETAGSHCAPRACLHWGWIEGAETYLDPLRLVGGGPVRLLPLAAPPGVSRVARPPSGAMPLLLPGPEPAWRPLAARAVAAQARGCACW